MTFVFLVFMFLFSPSIHAQDEEVDFVALAKVLVKDGYYQRAERTLRKIKKTDEDQKAVIEGLWGMVELHKKKYDLALERFDRSLHLGIETREIYLYRAEAFLQTGRFNDAMVSLEKIEPEEKKKLPYFIVKAEIHWKQKEKNEAWAILNQAEALKLSRNVIGKKKFYYFLEEGLYHTATDRAFELIQDPDNFNDVLAMGSQLRIKKQYNFSLRILQTLALIRPDKEMVALEMAQNYIAMGETYSAALILEEATRHNASLAFEAAELLRQVGKSYRAEFVNFSTLDPSKRLKQKLALYLEDDDYHSLKFMIPQLRKNRMLDDQEIRYAVAYSLFRTGDFSRSENYLNSIDQDGLFEKSIELKKEISNCQEEKWACSETI